MYQKQLWGAALTLLVMTVVIPPIQADDWPQWRGIHRDAKSGETGLLSVWPEGGPKLVWNSQEVNNGNGIGRGLGSISVANGKIYTMGDQRGTGCFVYCLDEKTGKNLWETKISDASRDGPQCTPTVDGDKVYAISRQGNLVCLNANDGKLVWQTDFGGDFGGRIMSRWDYSESPLIDGDKLICTPGADDAAMVALNKKDGTVIWKAGVPQNGGAGYASIVTADAGGIKQYITFTRRYIIGVKASDGTLLWQYKKVTNGTANIPTPIVKDDLVFCSTAYGTGAALLKLIPDGTGGVNAKELYFYRGNTLQNHHGGIVLVDDHVYGGHGHNDGQPFCLEMKSGKFAWGPEKNPASGSFSVISADGHLYFRYQDGTMFLVEATPEKFHVKSSFSLPRESGRGRSAYTHPVIANGKLYIRGSNMLLCYDIKK